MAKVQRFVMVILTLTVAACFAVLAVGCKESTTDPVEDLSVPDDIFPLVATRYIEFNGYLAQNDTETKITASETGYYTKWHIATSIPITAVFPSPPFTVPSGNAILIRDTTKIPGVGVASKFTPVFVRYDSATAEYQFMTNIGLFFRTFNIYKTGTTSFRDDSLRFIFLAKPRAGLAKDFNAFEETFTGVVQNQAAPVTLQITGQFEAKEDLVIGTTTYNTYRLVIKRNILLGPTSIATGVTAKIWVVKGVGPVKMWLYGDAENHGNFRTMTNKSF